MDYLYRYDRLDQLRTQAPDPVLRARRVTQVQGAWDHHQVLAALAKLAPTEGVYRFCFWKNWDAANRQLLRASFYSSPPVLQRVRADHPALATFDRDDDEYVRSDAWIFWRTDRVEPTRPDWSPEGIPHEDMEVLTPARRWERLSTSSLMREASLDHWRCLPLPGNGSLTPVFGRTLVRRVDGHNAVWVLLRQRNGPWTAVWRDPERLADATRLMLGDLGAVGCAQVRWVVSFECEDRVLTSEFFPSIERPAPSFVDRVLRYRRAGVEDLVVSVEDRFAPLDADAQRRLYHDFGIGEVLLLQRRYAYPQDLLQSETVMEMEPASP